ncbi:MAG: hypothetical protein CSA62_14740 [Planctomycetota bacterium]|nr:MAG: hypothetical protein CSA62_14740 [Planctomycetota bacterium]
MSTKSENLLSHPDIQADPKLVDFADACAWSALHRIPTLVELRQEIDNALAELLPEHRFQLSLNQEELDRPLGPNEHCIPIHYDDREIGQLTIEGEPEQRQLCRIEGLLVHAATAYTQLHLRMSQDQALEAYCACVEAMHEGMGLFQELDPSATSERFLDLTTHAVHAQAGALLLREEFGNGSSALRNEALLGLPLGYIEKLVDENGCWWPEQLGGSGLIHLARNEKDELPGLANSPSLQPIDSLIACPLEYQLFPVGQLLLFNLSIDEREREAKFKSLMSLCSLGAAIFHRLAIDRDQH